MEILIASTKKVEEDNEGFQTVVKRNRGNNKEEKQKEETKNKNLNVTQGQKGINQGGGKTGNGNSVSIQGQKGNKNAKIGISAGGGQRNKGKGNQGHYGKNQNMNGNTYGRNFEQGQSSKNINFMKRENGAAGSMGKKDNVGSFSGNGDKEEVVKAEVRGKMNVAGQKYIPNSGQEFKVSSNFDSKPQSLMGLDSRNLLSKNKFDALNDLEDENPFIFSKKGVDEADLAYLDFVDQMEVIGGIPLSDTNMETYLNDD